MQLPENSSSETSRPAAVCRQPPTPFFSNVVVAHMPPAAGRGQASARMPDEVAEQIERADTAPRCFAQRAVPLQRSAQQEEAGEEEMW